ncbi:hypothetical protein CKAH01_06748 [Colletotrichum kahawae]|uniref:Uncharacterized protein n=1 Tax=Colletotrichum kahawae TaxID=34407 RepID=A0AAD9Y7J6_COLKA|nr:hypothetical protein CKAH01_06748 [Colletotrichum kahawae]
MGQSAIERISPVPQSKTGKPVVSPTTTTTTTNINTTIFVFVNLPQPLTSSSVICVPSSQVRRFVSPACSVCLGIKSGLGCEVLLLLSYSASSTLCL